MSSAMAGRAPDIGDGDEAGSIHAFLGPLMELPPSGEDSGVTTGSMSVDLGDGLSRQNPRLKRVIEVFS